MNRAGTTPGHVGLRTAPWPRRLWSHNNPGTGQRQGIKRLELTSSLAAPSSPVTRDWFLLLAIEIQRPAEMGYVETWGLDQPLKFLCCGSSSVHVIPRLSPVPSASGTAEFHLQWQQPAARLAPPPANWQQRCWQLVTLSLGSWSRHLVDTLPRLQLHKLSVDKSMQ